MNVPASAPRASRRGIVGVAAAVFAAFLAVAACGGSSSSPKTADQGCALNSDCQGGLICALGKCRAECKTAADCTPAASTVAGSCITDGAGHAVCQYPTD